MTGGPVLNLFSLICAIGAITVVCGTWLEMVRMHRGDTTLTPRHYRWRLLSTVVWVGALGAMGYAASFSWPKNKLDKVTAQHFLDYMGGGICLFLVGILLLGFDLWMTAKERDLYSRKLQVDLDVMAREEIQRLRAGRPEGESKP